jgi:hypothetical protein
MRAEITKQSVKLNGALLSGSLKREDLLTLLGEANRKHVISCSMSVGGTRTSYIYDEFGIIFCHDEPEDRLSHLTLALSPIDTFEEPAQPFPGSITIDGTLLDSDTSEKPFLRAHGQHLTGHHRIYSYTSAEVSCWFGFHTKKKNRLGKKAGPCLLSCVQVSFPKESQGI